METKDVLASFDWRGHQFSILHLKPCAMVQGRPTCILTIRVESLLAPPFEFQHPFYRSSGRNSGMPDVWLPFHGINGRSWWFSKYIRDPLEPEPEWSKWPKDCPHGRFKYPIYKMISEQYLKHNEEWVDDLPIVDNCTEASKLCPLMDMDEDDY